MQGLTEGRVVHYARPSEVKDHCLAAVVTRVFPGTVEGPTRVNLHVFKDGAQQMIKGGGTQPTMHVRDVTEQDELRDDDVALLDNTFHDPRDCPRQDPNFGKVKTPYERMVRGRMAEAEDSEGGSTSYEQSVRDNLAKAKSA